MDQLFQNFKLNTDEWIQAGITFACFLGIALLIRLSFKKLVMPFFKKNEPEFAELVIVPLRKMVQWAVVFTGVHYALLNVTSMQTHPQWSMLLTKGLTLAWVALAIFITIRLVNGLVDWNLARHGHEALPRTSITKKLLTVTIGVIGLLYLLRAIGVDISPLLASGAVGGLVLGLALQDTLSNIFAGFFMNIDRPIQSGDLVRLEWGDEGFVEEIGWRYSKIRLWSNAIVMVPNNKLSQSAITNLNLPEGETSVYINALVSYDTDLSKAEEVALQVGREILAQIPGSEKSWEPLVRWQEFGESGVTFRLILRADSPTEIARIRSECIKALHRGFQEAGIKIPYPTRTVLMQNAP